MKYFTYERIEAANDWIEQSESKHEKAKEDFRKAGKLYFEELESIKQRVSKPAWEFFRYGFAEYGLHDARLLSFNIGDNEVYSAAKSAFERKRGTSAKIHFLSQTRKYYYTFDLRGVKSSKLDISIDEDLYEKNIGDLFAYELTEFDSEFLQLGFFFASGAEINVIFRKLVFKRQSLPFKS